MSDVKCHMFDQKPDVTCHIRLVEKLIVNTIPGLLDQSAPLLDLCDNSDPRDVTTLIGAALTCCNQLIVDITGEAVAGFSQPVGGKSPGLVIDGKSISSLFKQVAFTI